MNNYMLANNLNDRIAELERQNAKLKKRLRDQTDQTQKTYQQTHDAVVATLRHYDVIPDGLDVAGHPIEQVVGTCIAALQSDLEAARRDAERYRWIRDEFEVCELHDWQGKTFCVEEPYELDSAVDAALAAGGDHGDK